MHDAEREQRAVARQGWPVREIRLSEEDAGNDVSGLSRAERLTMMWRLTVDGLRLSGRAIPDYPRDAAPGRVVRASDDASR